MNIRIMTTEDYEKVYNLWLSCVGMGLNNLDDSKEGIARFFKRNPSTNFAAYKNGKMVGAILSGHDGRRGYIYHTVVLPKYRKQGITSALVKAAVKALQKEGITRVCLNIMEKNENGKQFWLHKGWEKRTFLAFTANPFLIKKIRPCLRYSMI